MAGGQLPAAPSATATRGEGTILCVGALTFDLMFFLDRLPAGPGKVLAGGFSAATAGMATSAAMAVARLGLPVDLWASVGDDPFADVLLADLRREGIGTRHVRRVAGARSALSAVLVERGGERLVVPFYDAGLASGTDPAPDPADHAAVLADVRWPDAAEAALAGARAAGRPAVLDLDTGPRDILARLARVASHVVASASGAAILSGVDDPAAGAALLATDLRVPVLATCGAAGVVVADGPGRAPVRVPGIPVEAVDTNAAGDVFHGAFVTALAEGRPLEAAARWANAAAALKCTRTGGPAGAPGRAELEAFVASLGGV